MENSAWIHEHLSARIAAVGVLSLLAVLGLMGLAGNTALGQSYTYSPCWTEPAVEPPYPWWQILDGGSPYVQVTGNDCLWYHTVNTLAVGQGWGVTHIYGTVAGAIYEVDIQQPSANVSTDVIFGVVSTNCAASARTTPAFQAGHSAGTWSLVCYLTNNPSVLTPEIEFHYVSGVNARTYIDSIRFTQVGVNLPACPAITCFNCTGGHCTIGGTGAVGKTFILQQITSLAGPPGSWTPVQTNTDGAGAFGFVVEPGAAPSAFFRVLAQ